MMTEEIRETPRVVWMGVRHHERVDAENFPRPEEGTDDGRAGVEVAARKAPRIHHHHPSIW